MGGFLLIGVMIVTLIILVAGIFLMATGGEKNRKYGNKVMGLRVTAQALALVVLAVLFLMKDGS